MSYSYENKVAAQSILNEIIREFEKNGHGDAYTVGYLCSLIGTLAAENESVVKELVECLDYAKYKRKVA
jgi:hypothetical protein